jgi:flagellar hook-basal body complex protein FliE
MTTDPVNPEGVDPSKEVGGQPPEQSPDQSAFQREMDQASAPPSADTTPTGVTPMGLTEPTTPTEGPTIDSLNSQITDSKNNLQNIQNDLNANQNMKFKKSQEYLMKNKLQDANEHIQSAGEKLGATMPENKEAPPGSGPVNKFINLLESGQNNLQAASDHLNEITTSGKQIDPGDMLLVQIKLSQAQQEINFTSILVSKVVEGFKTISQTQI